MLLLFLIGCVLLLLGPAVAGAAPTAEDCAVCHAIPSGHVSPHASPGLSGRVELFTADHQGAGTHIGIDADCGMCHDLSNISAIHGDRCSKCHPSPRNSFTTWNKGCQQGGCHTTYHTRAAAGHVRVGEESYQNGCLGCHDSNTWAVSLAKCGNCHALVDHVAPVTSADALTSYVGPATVKLSAADLPSPGGSGVAHTYCVIDGGERREGALITVAQPASGTAAHTIRYWSVDNAGNSESTKTASFTVTADLTPPSTTSDARASYSGPARVTLTATDNGTAKPTTYYVLDGGATTTGTVVAVSPPSAGYVTHTLEFWSVDGAGNVEAPRKTVTFDVGVDTVAPVTTSDARAFYKGDMQETIKLTATDAGSGVYQTYYRIDGGQAFPGRWLFVDAQTASGPHTLQFWSVDNVGNVEAAKTVTFTVDRTPPSTTSDAVLLYTASATIHLSPIDGSGGSGVAATWYRLDGAPATTGTVLTVPVAGMHVLEFWSADGVGNAELPHRSVTFTVLGAETTPPTTTSDAKASYVSSATIQLTATDNAGGSGVRTTYYSLDRATPVAGTTVSVQSPGTHTLDLWSVDNAGNEESPHKTVSFTITVPSSQGTIQFAWTDPPPGSWTYYYVYDADGALVASGYNTTGWYIVNVPVSSRPYTLRAYWYSEEDPGYPVWSYGSTLIDVSGKVVTWYY
jgi:hypothetical protein